MKYVYIFTDGVVICTDELISVNDTTYVLHFAATDGFVWTDEFTLTVYLQRTLTCISTKLSTTFTTTTTTFTTTTTTFTTTTTTFTTLTTTVTTTTTTVTTTTTTVTTTTTSIYISF